MREYLFRGKHEKTGAWVCGNLWHHTDKASAIYSGEKDRLFWVRPETVGQFTGLEGKDGVKIFEGDIMRLCSGTYPCLVYWDGRGWAWLANGKRRDIDMTRDRMDIVGNIHDNPELLEVIK